MNFCFLFLAFGSTPVLICMVPWLEISRREQTLCWPRPRFSWMTRRFCLMKWRLGDNRLWQRPTCVSIYPQNTELIKVLYILRDVTKFFFFYIFLVLIHSNSKWTENVTFPSQWLQNWWGQGYQDNRQQCTNVRGHSGSVWLRLQISKVPVS